MTATEQRQEVRMPFVSEVVYEQDGIKFAGRSTDLSAGGIYIEHRSPPAEGTRIRVQFLLDGYPITTRGRVVNCEPYMGFGVSFDEMDENDRILVRLRIADSAAVAA